MSAQGNALGNVELITSSPEGAREKQLRILRSKLFAGGEGKTDVTKPRQSEINFGVET